MFMHDYLLLLLLFEYFCLLKSKFTEALGNLPKNCQIMLIKNFWPVTLFSFKIFLISTIFFNSSG